MIFHASIDAADPRQVAYFIADLWDGKVMPFPAVIDGSWIVLAGDERGSAIEVYPRGTVLNRAIGDADAYGVRRIGTAGTATHLAIATELSHDAVVKLAASAGWAVKYRKRADLFGVIEVWVENRVMLEVLTPTMQAEYVGSLAAALAPRPSLATAA